MKKTYGKYFDMQLKSQPIAFRNEFKKLEKEIGYEKAKSRFRARHYDIFD